MWSGPRNLSTALMRSFAQRSDTKVWDEPFYAAYLANTGMDHPMREEIIADGLSDARDVIAACCEPVVPPLRLFYQKHMTHHMIPEFDLTWMDNIEHAFLIRSPERVLASYSHKRQEVEAADLGYRLQRELFERVANKLGKAPVVISSADICKAPERMLKNLCQNFK